MDGWPDRIPDGIEPLVGYRMWVYTLRHGQAVLHSLNSFYGQQLSPDLGDWEDAETGWLVASCIVGFHPLYPVPDEHCSCGFYAMTTLPRLLAKAPRLLFPLLRLHKGSMGPVFGRVELAGKIIQHEHGYRAERARITELIPIRGTERAVMRLAARLRIPIGPPSL